MPDELLNISGSDCTAKIFTFINFAILTGINKNHDLTVHIYNIYVRHVRHSNIPIR